MRPETIDITAGDQIWFVEDDLDYYLLLESASRLAGFTRVRRVASAQELRDRVEAALDGASAPVALPALISMDVGLPDAPGLQMLQWLRSNDSIVRLPVIVLSGSRDPAHFALARRMGATEYLVKPDRFEELKTILLMIRSLWFGD